MKSIKKILLFLLLLMGSFNPAKADTVDNFQIYRNKKLILNDSGFGSARSMTNLLLFSKNDIKDTLEINFSHCFAVTINRKIQLLDKYGKVICKWNFPDKELQAHMFIPINDIWQSVKEFPKKEFQLKYYDEQWPDGTFLSLIQAKIN